MVGIAVTTGAEDSEATGVGTTDGSADGAADGGRLGSTDGPPSLVRGLGEVPTTSDGAPDVALGAGEAVAAGASGFPISTNHAPMTTRIATKMARERFMSASNGGFPRQVSIAECQHPSSRRQRLRKQFTGLRSSAANGLAAFQRPRLLGGLRTSQLYWLTRLMPPPATGLHVSCASCGASLQGHMRSCSER